MRWLHDNQFTGVPPDLSGLTQLWSLYLWPNNFPGCAARSPSAASLAPVRTDMTVSRTGGEEDWRGDLSYGVHDSVHRC